MLQIAMLMNGRTKRKDKYSKKTEDTEADRQLDPGRRELIAARRIMISAWHGPPSRHRPMLPSLDTSQPPRDRNQHN
jgi:hypothetical protein